MELINKAIKYATEKHNGVYRDSTLIPYVLHPLEAGMIVASITYDEDLIAAAILHDTVEDTDATEEDIIRLFGKRVAEFVMSDTENKRPGIPSEYTWDIRKQETLDHLENSSREEQIICIGDKLSNMRSIYNEYLQIGDKVWNKFSKPDKIRQGWYYGGIADRLDKIRETGPYKEYCMLCHEIFGEWTKQ